MTHELRPILLAACRVLRTDLGAILSRNKHPDTLRDRAVCVGCLRDIPSLTPSFPEIQRAFGEQNNSVAWARYQRWLRMPAITRHEWLERVATVLGLDDEDIRRIVRQAPRGADHNAATQRGSTPVPRGAFPSEVA